MEEEEEEEGMEDMVAVVLVGDRGAMVVVVEAGAVPEEDAMVEGAVAITMAVVQVKLLFLVFLRLVCLILYGAVRTRRVVRWPQALPAGHSSIAASYLP